MLFELLPTKIVLCLAKPYLAGWNSHEAFETAQKIWADNGFSGTIDVLGEDSLSSEQCESYVQIYMGLIDHVAANPLPAKENRRQLTVSFKPSMFCIVASADAFPIQTHLDDGYARMDRVVNYAYKHNVRMTLEAEDHRWTDFHLNSYFALLNSGYNNLGTVLQTRLFRTAEDIKRFDEHTRVRLVTGIYKESAQIAYTENEPMKEALISYSRELLSRGAYVELATHDQKYIDKFFTDVVALLPASSEQFEIQFLLGVPRLKLQQRLAKSGILVRLYLPFGSGNIAAPYCRRRLKYNPNLIVYGIKNLLKMQL